MKRIVNLLIAASLAFSFLFVAAPAGAVIDSATVVPTPTAGAGATHQLLAVSCVTPDWCMAVGYLMDGSAQRTLTEKWDGTSWSIVPSPNTGALDDNRLTGVACDSPNWCQAVGSAFIGVAWQTIALVWDGTSWSTSTVEITSPTLSQDFFAISCVSPTACTAVGSASNGVAPQTLVETWDGSSWTIVPSPSVGTNQMNFLYGVSCVSSSWCVATGSAWTGSSMSTLALSWNGSTWSIVQSPNVGTASNTFASVSCPSTIFCVAVGNHFTGSTNQTLIETFDGTTWSFSDSPNTDPTLVNTLYSVSCASETSCTAVGTHRDTFSNRTLVLAWDGSSWTIVDSPNPATNLPNILDGVACSTTTSCTAVGSSYDGSATQSLVLALTGTDPVPPSTTSTTVAPEPVVPAFTG